MARNGSKVGTVLVGVIGSLLGGVIRGLADAAEDQRAHKFDEYLDMEIERNNYHALGMESRYDRPDHEQW